MLVLLLWWDEAQFLRTIVKVMSVHRSSQEQTILGHVFPLFLFKSKTRVVMTITNLQSFQNIHIMDTHCLDRMAREQQSTHKSQVSFEAHKRVKQCLGSFLRRKQESCFRPTPHICSLHPYGFPNSTLNFGISSSACLHLRCQCSSISVLPEFLNL